MITSIYTVIGSLVYVADFPAADCRVRHTVPASIFFTRFRSKRVRPLFHMRSQKLGELNGYAEEMLSGGSTIQAPTDVRTRSANASPSATARRWTRITTPNTTAPRSGRRSTLSTTCLFPW